MSEAVIKHTVSSPSALITANQTQDKLHLQLAAANFSMTCFMIFKAIVGAGLFAMPYAFKLMGWGGGLLSMVFLGALTFYTSIVIVRVHDVVQRDTLQKHLTFVTLAQHCLGKTAGHFVYFLMGFTTVGTVGSFLVFNGSVLHSMFPEVSIFSWAAVVAVVMLPFSMIQNPKFLSYSSLGGNIGVVIVVMVILVGGAQVGQEQTLAHVPFLRANTFLYGIGIVGYMYSCSRSIITIEKAMKKKQDFSKAFTLTILVVFVVAVIFSLANLAYFGDDTCSVVVINLGSGPASYMAKFAIVLDLAFTIPISIAPLVEIVSKSLYHDGTPHLAQKQGIMRTIFLLGSLLFALFPNFSILVNLVGGMSAAALQFILPCAMLLALRKHHLASLHAQQATNAALSHGAGHIVARSPNDIIAHPEASPVAFPTESPTEMANSLASLPTPALSMHSDSPFAPTPASNSGVQFAGQSASHQPNDGLSLISNAVHRTQKSIADLFPSNFPIFSMHHSPSQASDMHTSASNQSIVSMPASEHHTVSATAHVEVVSIHGHRVPTFNESRVRSGTSLDVFGSHDSSLSASTMPVHAAEPPAPIHSHPTHTHTASHKHGHGVLHGHKKHNIHVQALHLLGVGTQWETAALYGCIVFGFALWILTTALSIQSMVSSESSSLEPGFCTGE